MLNTLTITQAHIKLKAKEISSVELTQACIDQIENVDDKLNAVVHRNFDRALEQAKKIDSEGKFEHTLTGIPYLAKDIYCEEGVPTTACSNILRDKDYIPPFNSTVTRKLNEVGAISIGKANCDQFAQGTSNETSCYGHVHNPWDLERVPGGTSGGSAAAAIADECIFASGTDTGGSIRQPASLCGCIGLKPSYGRVSRYGVMAMTSSLDTMGILSKTVEDAAIFLQTVAGKDTLDATTSDRKVPDYSKCLDGDVKGMKFGIPKEYFIDDLDNEVAESVKEAAKTLEKLGAEIKEVSLPHTKYGVAAYYIICPSEVSSNMARYDGIRYGHTENAKDLIEYYFNVRSAGFGDEVKRRIMIGTYALSAGYYDAYYRQAMKVRTLVRQDFTKAFEDIDALLTPASPIPAFKIGEKIDDPIQMYLADMFTVPASLAGICGLSVPCGMTKNNLPIGLQILGPQWGEETIFKAGHAYEKAVYPDGIAKPELK
ncbi:Asp-tRNA(Asn)/Glu-tRNA(Gln) amidotransferase subunit GatA [Patescibacteria group bacterium]|nr:Asp-tRNA(Asn)/Glu-tRNA(Gln) amidotransferase subunit GatA [Patescibacteria group bacterium]MBU1123485.1 Asp-tRNA(Asn)/Glu-tRNA(Gln) amidotransferase subunit GatA [Patescibacteria group bacterium]MBU1911453.1 Asp-tRNA(Asn)/Glu-tRNA(Gln) amidotransferase subunit GatA [Patescibacteria group bacterium]